MAERNPWTGAIGRPTNIRVTITQLTNRGARVPLVNSRTVNAIREDINTHLEAHARAIRQRDPGYRLVQRCIAWRFVRGDRVVNRKTERYLTKYISGRHVGYHWHITFTFILVGERRPGRSRDGNFYTLNRNALEQCVHRGLLTHVNRGHSWARPGSTRLRTWRINPGEDYTVHIRASSATSKKDDDYDEDNGGPARFSDDDLNEGRCLEQVDQNDPIQVSEWIESWREQAAKWERRYGAKGKYRLMDPNTARVQAAQEDMELRDLRDGHGKRKIPKSKATIADQIYLSFEAGETPDTIRRNKSNPLHNYYPRS